MKSTSASLTVNYTNYNEFLVGSIYSGKIRYGTTFPKVLITEYYNSGSSGTDLALIPAGSGGVNLKITSATSTTVTIATSNGYYFPYVYGRE